MNDSIDQGLSCIDPKVGKRILQLITAESSSKETDRNLLTAHAETCAYCSLALDLHRRLGDGIRDGSLPVVSAKVVNPSNLNRWTGWSAVTVLAASLTLMFLMPPQPVGPSLVLRGEGNAGFIRPIEGEVVAEGDLSVSWTAIPGADSYRIDLTGGQSGLSWSGESRDTNLIVPVTDSLEHGDNLRIILSSVPADLLPPGGVSVNVNIGGRYSIIAHRIRHAPPVALGLGLVGLLLAVFFALGRRYPLNRKELKINS